MAVGQGSIPAALREQARQQPDAPAYTFIDYEVDPAGYSQSLTWSQVHQRAQVVAEELASCGSPGDRVAILAPQGLEYIVGVLGAMAAGFIAVPLSVPLFGTLDERVSAALRDSSPAAILTTSAVVNDVVSCAHALPGSRAGSDRDRRARPLYTAGLPLHQTRRRPRRRCCNTPPARPVQPAGVVVTHKNIMANLDQIMSDYFEDKGGVPPPDATLVSWLPFYHDMGLMFGIFIPVAFGLHSVLTSPMAFLQKPARWMQLMASNTKSVSPAPNFAFELAARRTSDDDMAGLDLGNVLTFISGAERVHPATVRRFTERFSRFNLPDTALRAAYGLAEATVYVASSNPGHPAPTVRFDYEKLSAGHAKRVRRMNPVPSWSATAHRGPAPCASSTLRRASRIRPARSGRSGCTATTSRTATGETRNCRSRPSVDGSSTHRPARRTGPGCGPEIWASCPTASCSSSAASRIC